jgi:hypothetical protein
MNGIVFVCLENLQDRLSSSFTELESSASESLSPLHFFFPASQVPQELLPLQSRPALQSELSKKFGHK